MSVGIYTYVCTHTRFGIGEVEKAFLSKELSDRKLTLVCTLMRSFIYFPSNFIKRRENLSKNDRKLLLLRNS